MFACITVSSGSKPANSANIYDQQFPQTLDDTHKHIMCLDIWQASVYPFDVLTTDLVLLSVGTGTSETLKWFVGTLPLYHLKPIEREAERERETERQTVERKPTVDDMSKRL